MCVVWGGGGGIEGEWGGKGEIGGGMGGDEREWWSGGEWREREREGKEKKSSWTCRRTTDRAGGNAGLGTMQHVSCHWGWGQRGRREIAAWGYPARDRRNAGHRTAQHGAVTRPTT